MVMVPFSYSMGKKERDKVVPPILFIIVCDLWLVACPASVLTQLTSFSLAEYFNLPKFLALTWDASWSHGDINAPLAHQSTGLFLRLLIRFETR